MDEYGYGYGYGDGGYGYGGGDYNPYGTEFNPMGLPSVADLNHMADQSYAQTTAALNAQVSQMNTQYEWYGQQIDAMNYDGRYDGLLAQADRADAQMAYEYQQYNNASMAQTNAESWDQADAQAYWTRQNL